MLCARECPDWCIYIDSHKETIPATTEGGRERQRNVLDRFAIDFSLCMYCGICIEVCPFDALHWSPQFEYAEVDILDLLHKKGRLERLDGHRAPTARARREAAEPAGDRRRQQAGPRYRPGRRAGEAPAVRVSGCRARCVRALQARRRRRRRRRPTVPPPAEGAADRHAASRCNRRNQPPTPPPADDVVVTALDTAFAATALVAVAGGLLAVTTRHVVHAALWLVVALLGWPGAARPRCRLVALVLCSSTSARSSCSCSSR